ncbi:hypothetical protein VNI00_001011 [Paramarasmius palmivorus]|uniref:Uncharacterized protein n=1 Tax=Paramarasmius palmivorus TaxID=297713 RepID=A0AAW0E9N6_9AGAR
MVDTVKVLKGKPQPRSGLLTTSIKRLQDALSHSGNIRFIKRSSYQVVSPGKRLLTSNSTFQQAVLRNLNDKNTQLQKQLDSIVREGSSSVQASALLLITRPTANSEIALLNNKKLELEQDLENEKRKVRDLQEAMKEQEKEYQKLKAQNDKMKRKTVLAPNLNHVNATVNGQAPVEDSRGPATLRTFASNMNDAVDIGAVVGGMEANGIQRTPIVNRTGTYQGPQRVSSGEGGWVQPAPTAPHAGQQRTFGQPGFKPKRATVESTNRSGYMSDRSDSANEVENLLVGGGAPYSHRISTTSGWQAASVSRHRQAAQPQKGE